GTGAGIGAGAASSNSSKDVNNESDDSQDDKDTNRYGNSIDEENEAHDDVDDHSTASTLAGTTGLGAAGYAANQSEQNENETLSSDNERDLDELKNRNNNDSKPPYGEADNVKDQRDLTREDESEFTRVHDDSVETERSFLNDERSEEHTSELQSRF